MRQEETAENDELSIATLRLLLNKIKEKSKILPVQSRSTSGSNSDNRGVPDGCSNITSSSSNPNQAAMSSEQAQLMESSIRNLKERCGALEAQNTVMKRYES